VSTLHGTNSGEGPARSTLTLVLDMSNSALGDPVHLLIKVTGVKVFNSVGILKRGLVFVHGLSLSRAKIGELIDTNSPSVVGSIVLLNKLEVISKESKSLLVL